MHCRIVRPRFAVAALPRLPPLAHGAGAAPAGPPDVAAARRRARRARPASHPKVDRRRARAAEKPMATDVVTVHYTGWAAATAGCSTARSRAAQPSTFPLNRVMAGLARVRAADDRRREAALLGAAGAGLPRARPAGRPARWSSISSCSIRGRRRRFLRPTSRSRRPTRSAPRTGWPTRSCGRATARASRRPWQQVTVHYTGWTTDGKMFDSSVARGAPTTMRPRRSDQGLDRGRAADGRRRAHALLDSRGPRLQGRRPAARAACWCSTSS